MTALQVFFGQYPTAFPVLAVLLGLVVGSFLNVVILRLPVMLERQWRQQCVELAGSTVPAEPPHAAFNLVVPGSHCRHCGHRIGALENIPLLSFLWLQGKCAACRQPISWRYPAVELLTGVLSGIVAWHLGFGIAALAAIALTWTLIALAFIDFDHQLLPDDITLPLLWAGLLLNLSAVFASPTAAVIGAMTGYLFLWLVYHAFRLVTGKEGMGHGDFKLLAVFGAWLGWQQLPLIILFSSFLGAVVGIGVIVFFGRDRHRPIPFGPFLCLAGWIALLWGDALTRVYLQFARLA
jgi:leader peptidase (prepilin peptidase)/N-methyltransferase